MSTLRKAYRNATNAIAARTAELRQRSEDGFTTIEWVVIIVGVLALVAIVIVAINAFVTGKIALWN